MAQRSHVPKFGNWESEENVPYTAYFDKARKGRGGTKMINPNDPEDNPDLVSDNSSSAHGPAARAETEEPVREGAGRSTHDRRSSREDGDVRQFTDSPARHDNSGSRGQGGRETHRRPARPSTGSEYGVERSPLHSHAKVPVRDGGVNSYTSEGKSYDSSHGTPGRYDNSHGTPGRFRKPETRGDETPEKGAAVPKFGEWDENNPASADGFTHIFNKVREERQIGVGRAPGSNGTPYNNTRRRQDPDDNAKSCCFPWGRK